MAGMDPGFRRDDNWGDLQNGWQNLRGRRMKGSAMTEQPARQPFRLEEATIDELHAAIQAGETNCVDVVRQYIERARAYNGVASRLVTADGGRIPEAVGAVRAGAPLAFPTAT